VILRQSTVSALCLLVSLFGACKTPNRSSDRSDLNATETNIIKLKDFNHELSLDALQSLGRRIGCSPAAQLMLSPVSGSLRSTVDTIYKSEAPYDTVLNQLFNFNATEKLCASAQTQKIKDQAYAMGKLLAAHKAKGVGLTFVMVGGFGSHLTEQGALYDSRNLWQARFGSENKYFRIIRHECEPNSFATDDICSPLLAKRFSELEATRGGVEHRYLFWGYSKGGNSILKALSTSPEMREKTLALITVGSPIGGGLPIRVAQPIIQQVAQKKAAMSPVEQATFNALLTFGSGTPFDSKDSSKVNKLSALFSDAEFNNLRDGFDSISLTRRKEFVNDEIKTWNFSRSKADPVSGGRDLPIFHVAASVDIARLNPIPNLTVDQSGDVVVDQNSYEVVQLAEMATLTSFRSHPLSDTCVALEHAVIPRDAVPKGASSRLLAILNLDHMRLGLSNPSGTRSSPIPNVEIVDSLIEGVMRQLGVSIN